MVTLFIMKKPLALSFFLSILFCVPARADRFILNGDTCHFWYTSPLKQYPGFSALLKKLDGFASEPCFDCHVQGYDAEWTLIDNSLYLTNIYSEFGSKLKLKADINKLFNVKGGKVKADWVTQELWIPIGKEVSWLDMMTAVFKAETHITVIKGQLEDIKRVEYPGNSGSVYAKYPDSLCNFVYSHIQWHKLTPLNDKQKIIINFTTGPSGKPENIRILRPVPGYPWADEIISVISMIPWPGYYWHGTLQRRSWSVPLIFSEAARRKYAR